MCQPVHAQKPKARVGTTRGCGPARHWLSGHKARCPQRLPDSSPSSMQGGGVPVACRVPMELPLFPLGEGRELREEGSPFSLTLVPAGTTPPSRSRLCDSWGPHFWPLNTSHISGTSAKAIPMVSRALSLLTEPTYPPWRPWHHRQEAKTLLRAHLWLSHLYLVACHSGF